MIVDRRGNRLTVGCLVALVVARELEFGEVVGITPLWASVRLTDDPRAPPVMRRPWHMARVEAFHG